MANEKVTVRNTHTGQVGVYPRRLFENKAIMKPDVFEEVTPGTKPYVKELYKPRKARKSKEETPETNEPEVTTNDSGDETLENEE